MAICDSALKSDLIYNCDFVPGAGLDKEILLVNFDDIDRQKSELSSDGGEIRLKKLVLNQGKKCFVVRQSDKGFDGTQWEVSEGTYVNGYTHTLSFAVIERSAANNATLEALFNGCFVAIIANKGQDGEAKYEVFGYNTGLGASVSGSRNYVDEEAAGATMVSLVSGKEPHLPLVFFGESAEATKAMYESLKSVANE